MTPASTQNRKLRLDYFLAVVATLVALALHGLFFLHAGALWRDEAGLAGLATLPSWHDVWILLTHDSFPILFPAVIRLWCGAAGSSGDAPLRLLGLATGLLVLASFWLACRWFRRGVPLLPLSLVAVNVVAVRAGDSLRAYGLGCALNVLSLALIWRVVQKPSRGNIVLAALAAMLSVQCLYQNAFFVLAACLGGLTVCARARRWRDFLCVLGIGLFAALSLVPYVMPVIHSQGWWQLERSNFNLNEGWAKAMPLLGFPWLECRWLWVVLCVLAAVLAWKRSRAGAAGGDLTLFCAVALWAGILGFYAFLKSSGLMSEYWYSLPLLAFVAVCLDAALVAGARRWASLMLCALTLFALCRAVPSGFKAVVNHQTNVDWAARLVAGQAAPDDFIIVNPWYLGVTFNRYYHGPTPWNTIPPLEDHAFHRYDLFKLRMQDPQALQPLMAQLQATLQSGHRVWLVGSITLTNTAPAISSALNQRGSRDAAFSSVWSQQVGHEFLAHASVGHVVLDPMPVPVSPLEIVCVYFFDGWKAPAPAVAR